MKPFNIFIGISLLFIGAGFFLLGDLFRPDSEIGNETALVEIADNQETELNQDFNSYVAYSQANLETALLKGDTVLFFAATTWCQTCAALEEEILERISDIPEDMTILKVDYDNDRDMNRQHAVTAQHTMIVLDDQGEEATRWIGGGLDAIFQQVAENKS